MLEVDVVTAVIIGLVATDVARLLQGKGLYYLLLYSHV